jgi:hypothetical protein
MVSGLAVMLWSNVAQISVRSLLLMMFDVREGATPAKGHSTVTCRAGLLELPWLTAENSIPNFQGRKDVKKPGMPSKFIGRCF